MRDPRMDLDQSRQWGETVNDIEIAHVVRYALAAIYAQGKILDAACGCGYGSSILATKGPVVGVDADPQALWWAEEHYKGPKYIRGRIEESPWEGKFETVVSLETIEHLQDPAKALQAFRRSCIGRFIVSVPNEELYPFDAESFSNDVSPHYRHYTPQEFESLLNGHGFEVTNRYAQRSKFDPMPVLGTDGRFLVYVCV